MKLITNVLREFFTVAETGRVMIMLKHAAAILTNTLTFPLIPNNSAAVKAAGLELQTLDVARDGSKETQDAYDAQLVICNEIMEKNYNYVDLISGGSSATNLLAGCNSDSDNTTRTGAPDIFHDIQYVITVYPNQVRVEWMKDELAYGAILITTGDLTVTVVQSGPSQLKITCGTSIIYIDITTKSNAVVNNLIGGTQTKTSAAKFNPNGICPVVNLKTVVVQMP